MCVPISIKIWRSDVFLFVSNRLNRFRWAGLHDLGNVYKLGGEFPISKVRKNAGDLDGHSQQGNYGELALDINNDYGWRAADFDDVADSQQTRGFNWNAFLFAVAITMIVVNWGFLKPANQQLEQLKRQVSSLQSTVVTLTKHHGAAQQAMSLVDVLAAQGRASDEAADSLARIADLHDRLMAEARDLESSHQALTELASIRDEVVNSSQLLAETRHAVAETNRLQHEVIAASKQTAAAQSAIDDVTTLRMRLIQSIEFLEDAEPVFDEVAFLQEQVTRLADQVETAKAVASDVKVLADSLASESSRVYTASSALDGLVGIRNQLDGAGSDVAQSHETLDNLIQLKNDVIAEGASIPTAIETLEQTNDLHEQFVKAAHSFDQMRRWMGEVILMEPTIERAMTTLQPLTRLGELRRMTQDELRYAANLVQSVRERQIAAASSDSTESEEYPSIASKPEMPEGTTH